MLLMSQATRRAKTARPPLRLHPIPEAAAILGNCSEMHVYRQIANGELRAVDIASPGSGRPKTRIRSDDLEDYIERHTRHAGEMSAVVLDASGLADCGDA
jgi:excisionase family DNA binding protein